MKLVLILLNFSFFLLIFQSNLYAQMGSLETTFSSDGFTLLDMEQFNDEALSIDRNYFFSSNSSFPIF